MSEEERSKICPHCAEAIKTAANVCPHCRCWQKRWSLQNPQVGTTLWVLLLITAWCCLGVFFQKMFGPKEEFAIYRDEVAVASSQFSHRVAGTESNAYITVVGMLTNQSRVGWKDVAVEVQLFDQAGQLVDVIKANADYGGVTMLPHGDAAFKVEGKAARPISNYATHKAVVRWAKDIHAWLP